MSDKIIDTGKGWFMDDNFVDIIALHEVEPKFLQDLANAKLYKIVPNPSKNSMKLNNIEQ